MSRKTEILSAVDRLRRAHDDWEADDEAPVVPTVELERVINATIRTCEAGDVPAECRDLVQAVDAMGVEWRDYENGKRMRDQRPMPAFWESLRSVWRARAGTSRPKPRRPEPVRELVAQKVSYQQIAQRIYGWFNSELDRFEGPLLDDFGNPDIDLIHKESTSPGSVIPADWIHPSESVRVRDQIAAAESALEATERHEEARTEDPATIEELLRQGAFPQQVARAKNVSLEEVMEVAANCGITPAEMPNLASLRSPHEPALTPEQDAALQPGWQSGDQDDEDEESDGESEQHLTEHQIAELIVSTHEQFPNLGSPELVVKLRDLGAEVSVQKVSGVLRSHRKQSATA